MRDPQLSKLICGINTSRRFLIARRNTETSRSLLLVKFRKRRENEKKPE